MKEHRWHLWIDRSQEMKINSEIYKCVAILVFLADHLVVKTGDQRNPAVCTTTYIHTYIHDICEAQDSGMNIREVILDQGHKKIGGGEYVLFIALVSFF